jgi:hypothetical protein
MSALPPKADILERQLDVRFVPKADITHCSKNFAVWIPILHVVHWSLRAGQAPPEEFMASL